jgi:hypothetical protein
MRNSPMSPCYIFIILLVTFLITNIISCNTDKNNTRNTPPEKEVTKTEEISFSKEVEAVINRKKQKVEAFVKTPEILKILGEYNEKNSKLSLTKILELDEKWKNTEGMDDFIKTFIVNKCAQLIIQFQEDNEEFTEIFITDKNGLIVGESNKTSDYYQADEDWWVRAYNDGQGESFYGQIEYDESSRTESIPIYLPIINPVSQKAIGIIKVVCDITAIKMEL